MSGGRTTPKNLKVNIADLHRRLHQGSYRAQPGRRHYIPKADGKTAPARHRLTGGQKSSSMRWLRS
uniref:Retron-type RNA-directed DNA polymerase n=1 Tax=Klebsiella pneumoniae TaxID=573 RepID=A0A8B0STW3_KLEPN|nr:Retron-type RNA-directed DNA polymerase [Klebsiella pneumoniae]